MRIIRLLGAFALSAPYVARATGSVTEDPVATTFNGVDVPPLTAITGPDFKKTVAEGNWLVEFYSPNCGHCQTFAPVWQTLYEFYYTLKPMAASSSSDSDGLNTFSRYYNFKFARLNCVAYGDACMEVDSEMAWPTVTWFKDGKVMKKSVGVKSLPDMSKWLEEILESIRPGSRPASGPNLPKVDEHEAPAQPSIAPVASSTSRGLLKTPTKAKPTANPSGTSVSLTGESFQKLVTTTQDPWFVKFYAPWCHHCQAMGPSWAEMAREMQGSLNIGEVNCDVEKHLCKDAKVKGYPTILFFKGGERVEYNGLRGLGDLITYAKKAVGAGSGIEDVDMKSFRKMEETEEVIFMYFYDHATTSEDFAALERLTLSLIGHGRLVKTNDPELFKQFKISTWPRLMVSRDSKPVYYPHIAPKDMRDYRQILNWMKTVWQPLVPELTASNAQEIMSNSIVVLGILSRARSDEFVIAKREMKNAAMEWIDREAHFRKLERQELRDAKQLRMEEARDRGDDRALSRARGTRIILDDKPEVKFAWVDGVFWERWVKTTYGIDVRDGEKVIISDEDNHLYWDTTMTGNPIVPSRTSILETLPRILHKPPKIPSKSTSSKLGSVFYKLRATWRSHPWFSTLIFLILLIFSISLIRRYRRRSWGSGGFFSLDSEKGAFGNGDAKVD